MGMSERWGELTKKERMVIHHALRVLLTHPLRLPDDEERLVKRLADELWEQHAEEVAARP
jgi:hypothetical protein